MQFKSIYIAWAIMAVCAGSATAQSGATVNFDIRYLPSNIYTVSNSSEINTSITPVGITPAANKQLAIKGMAKPITVAQKSEMLMKTMIGKRDADSTCAVTYKMESMITTQNTGAKEIKQSNPLQGSTMYGKLSSAGKLRVDSINNSSFSEEYKKAFIASFNNVVNSVKYPSKVMHVGESFTQDSEINLPTGNGNLGINVKSTYTLIKKVDNLAYLDIKQNVSYKIDMGKLPGLKARGSGTGQMVYNINKQFADITTTSLNITMSIIRDDMKSNILLKMINTQKANVTPNL